MLTLSRLHQVKGMEGRAKLAALHELHADLLKGDRT